MTITFDHVLVDYTYYVFVYMHQIGLFALLFAVMLWMRVKQGPKRQAYEGLIRVMVAVEMTVETVNKLMSRNSASIQLLLW